MRTIFCLCLLLICGCANKPAKIQRDTLEVTLKLTPVTNQPSQFILSGNISRDFSESGPGARVDSMTLRIPDLHFDTTYDGPRYFTPTRGSTNVGAFASGRLGLGQPGIEIQIESSHTNGQTIVSYGYKHVDEIDHRTTVSRSQVIVDR